MKTLLIGNGFTHRYSEKFSYNSLKENLDNFEPRDDFEKILIEDLRKILKDDRYFIGSDFEKAIEYLEFIQDFLIKRTSVESQGNYRSFLNEINRMFEKLIREAEQHLLHEVRNNPVKYQDLFYDISLISTEFDNVFTLNFDNLYSYAVEELNCDSSYKGMYKYPHYLHFDNNTNTYVIGSIGDNKINIIDSNKNLRKTFEKFKEIEDELHILGCSLEKSDKHIVRNIVRNGRLRKIVFYLYCDVQNEEKTSYLKQHIIYNIFEENIKEKIEIKLTSDFEKLINANKRNYIYERHMNYLVKPRKSSLVKEYIAVNRVNCSLNIVSFEEVYNLRYCVFIPIKNKVKDMIIYHILNTIEKSKYKTGTIQNIDMNYLFKEVSKVKVDLTTRNVISGFDSIEKKINLCKKKVDLLEEYLVNYVKKHINDYRFNSSQFYRTSYANNRIKRFMNDPKLNDKNAILLKRKIELEKNKTQLIRQAYKSLVEELLFK